MNSRFASAAFLTAVLILSGCSFTPQPDPATTNLANIAQYYNQYASAHKGKGPPNEDAFKQFLAAKNVSDVDKLLISPRDKQPYKITYGESKLVQSSGPLVPPDQAPNQVIIAEEQTGVGGKKLGVYNSGVVKEVP